MARLEAGVQYFAFYSLCQQLISLFFRTIGRGYSLRGGSPLWKCQQTLRQNNCLLPAPGGILLNLGGES